jgi:mono/diheme cytochrome c family protein
MESTRAFLRRQLTPSDRPWRALTVCVLTLALLCSCDGQRRKSDAELGLHQAAGRQLYNQYCDRCHEPHSSNAQRGPSLKGVFKKQFLSRSGMPVNDESVGKMIVTGRNLMPGFGEVLSQQQVQDLLAYLHTL